MSKVLWIFLAVMASISPAFGQPPAAGKSVEKAAKTDQDRLQGKWQVMSIEMQGKVYKRDDKPDGWKIVFENEIVIEGNQLRHDWSTGGTFKLDEKQTPKQISFTDKENSAVFLGIYSIEGDTVTICVNGDGKSTKRPDDFKTKEDQPLILMTLKKMTDKK